VLSKENGTRDPRRVGQNRDKYKSRDHGCIQINDHFHYNHPGDLWNQKTGFEKIYDPVFNLEVAYDIYTKRQKLEGNGWRAWYGAKGIYW